MRFNQVSLFSGTRCFIPNPSIRIHALLPDCRRLHRCHDLQGCAKIRAQEPAGVYLHLLYRRIHFGDVGEGIRHCIEVDFCGQKSIFAPIDIRLHDCHCSLHSDTDELLQQGSKPIPNFHVSPEPNAPIRLLTHTVYSVNPVYYVTFTTATLCASFILFGGFNTTNAVNTISLLCGFLTIFTGVYLLNLSRDDPNGHRMLSGQGTDGIATDMISSIQTRRSMQARRSVGDPARHSIGSGYGRSDRDGLIRSYDDEENVGLNDLTEESENDAPLRLNGKSKAKANGNFIKPIDVSRNSSRSSRGGGPRSPMRSPMRSPRL